MHILALALTTLLHLHIATAIPTRSSPAACTTITPMIARIDSLHPSEAHLGGIQISQDAHGSNKQDLFAEFAVPPGVWGCTLSYFFPAGNHVSGSGSGSGAGSAPVEVFSAPAPLSRDDWGIDVTWDNAPEPIRQVGNVQFRDDEESVTTRVINSFACEEYMAYRFSIEKGYAGEAKVGFEQGDGSGLRMTYNC